MDKRAKFWNKIAARYAKTPIKDTEAYEHKLEVSRRYFSKESTVLEIGCGTGSTALLHAPYVKSYLATDISPEMINIANEKLKKENHENLTFKTAAIDQLDITEPIDIIFAHSILHLLEDREAVIHQIYQWLKPSGVLITSTACLGDRLKFFKYIGPIGKFLGLIPLVKVFTVEQLKQNLTGNNFDIEYEWKKEKI
jgi:ubiquinone/menaquinone biosynthesis C-methylase UbiE